MVWKEKERQNDRLGKGGWKIEIEEYILIGSLMNQGVSYYDYCDLYLWMCENHES